MILKYMCSSLVKFKLNTILVATIKKKKKHKLLACELKIVTLIHKHLLALEYLGIITLGFTSAENRQI